MSETTICPGDSLPPLIEKQQEAGGSESEEHIDEFFTRNGFDPSARSICDHFARSKYAWAKADASPGQGYCSYTLHLPDEYILQFRPKRHELDMKICDQAQAMYPSLAPKTAHVGVVRGHLQRTVDDEPVADQESTDQNGVLEVYLQERMPGVSLTRFRSLTEAAPPERKRECRRQLIEDMAQVFATSYMHRRYPKRTGKVGATVIERLDMLEGLPQDQKRAHRYLRAIRNRYRSFEPTWCLTHGDLVPENILVDSQTGRLSGLIDWAEGEWLPFGVGLYGLEELLGESDGDGIFEYYADHRALREVFWTRFLQITQPFEAIFSRRWLQEVRLCRAWGILLWRGIAFDDGRLDRVVDAERDASEIQKLEIFLKAPEPLESLGCNWRVELLLVGVGRLIVCSSGGLGDPGAQASAGEGLTERGMARMSSNKPKESWRELA